MDPPVSTGETDAGGSSSAKEPPLNGSGDAGGHKETSAEEAHTSGKETHTSAKETHTSAKEAHTSGKETHTSAKETHTSGKETHTSGKEAHTSGKETHKRAEPAAVPVKKIKVYHSVSIPVNINYKPFL